MRRRRALPAVVLLLALYLAALAPSRASAGGYLWTATASLRVPAVARTDTGFIGVMSNLTVMVAWPGHGYVYVSADPLAQLDMQAAARVAAVVASILAGYDYKSFDYFVRVEADSPIVGGPSASAAMAVGFLAAFKGSRIKSDFSMTGMIDPDATVGPVGGVPEKLTAAARSGVKLFVVPAGQLVARDLNTGAQVDLRELGRQLGVKVREAYTVLDAYAYATGDTSLLDKYQHPLRFSYPAWLSKSLNHTIEVFRKAAEGNITCAQGVLAGSPLPRAYSEIVGNLLQEAATALTEGSKLAGQGLLYSAASRYFYAAIVSTEACVVAKMLSSRDPVAALASLAKPFIDAANRTAGYVDVSLRGRLYNAEKLTDVDLQLAIAVLSRVQGAKESASAAARALAALERGEPATVNDLVRIAGEAVYSYYRSLTSLEWLNTLRQAWNQGHPIDPARLRSAASLYTYLVYTEASYSQALGVPAEDALTELEKVRAMLAQPNATLVDVVDALRRTVSLYADVTRNLRAAFNTGEAGVEAENLALDALSNLAVSKGYTPLLPALYQEYAGQLTRLDQRLSILVQGASYAVLLDLLAGGAAKPSGAEAPRTTTTTLRTTITTVVGGGGQPKTVIKTVVERETVTVTKTYTTTKTETSVRTVEAPRGSGAGQGYAAAAGLVVGVAVGLALAAAAGRGPRR